MTVASPYITDLNFTAVFDISKPQPEVVVTNTSTVVTPASIKWWFVITTPSGAYIHQGSLASPDANNVAWTTFTFTTWPLPFNQVEYGQYTITLFIKDVDNNTFNLPKTVDILRAYGNTPSGSNSNGVPDITVTVKCDTGQIYVEDRTPYAYNGIAPVFVSRDLVLVSPVADNGTPPVDTVSGTMNNLFATSLEGEGYQVTRIVVASYVNSQGITVKVKYRVSKSFAVLCDTDLCEILCDLDQLISKVDSCDPGTLKEISIINAELLQAVAGILRPGCAVDVAGKIASVKSRLGSCNKCS